MQVAAGAKWLEVTVPLRPGAGEEFNCNFILSNKKMEKGRLTPGQKEAGRALAMGVSPQAPPFPVFLSLTPLLLLAPRQRQRYEIC